MHETINGYPILATYVKPWREGHSNGRIILVDRGTEHEERYVVAWQEWNVVNEKWYASWEGSTYRHVLKNAHQEFFRRIEKYPEE